jgi:hypothetical protein
LRTNLAVLATQDFLIACTGSVANYVSKFVFRNKPSMQLVLWQPPGDFVRAVVKELAEGNAEKEREMDNDTVEQHESRLVS